MSEEKQTVSQEIAELLKATNEESPEGYTGAEWIEAMELLPVDVYLAIPWCVYDLIRDEQGVVVMEERFDHWGRQKDLDDDGNVDPDWTPDPLRRNRTDVLAVLVWIPMKREDPDLTLDDVKASMNNDNITELIRMVFTFWGVPMRELEEQIENAEDGEEGEAAPSEDAPEEEVADNENFTG